MREIKFRAWQKRLKEIYSVTGYHVNEAIYYCESEKGTRHTFGLIDLEIMQYTGLKDQNGIEVYEGDIVHVEPTGQAWSVEYDDQEACFIVFNQLNSTRRFDTDFSDPECPIVTICEGMEFKPKVIGNIYENKELIK
jgi:uncharacterized phage protein (TIGR01671 family)